MSAKTVMPLNPAMLFMVAALMSIEQKLDDIHLKNADLLL